MELARRPLGDSDYQQKLKYQAHKTANGVLNHYIATENYIGAYVIAHSLLEDRIRAVYVIVFRDIKANTAWRATDSKISIGKILKALHAENFLKSRTFNLAIKLTSYRNTLIHAAMYNVNKIQLIHVTDVVNLRNDFAKLVRDLKRQIKAELKEIN